MSENSNTTRGIHPEKFGHYEVVSELGRGGMGTVYRGYEPSLNRDVAIKVLAAHLAEDESVVARFLREAKSIAAISHPNITHVYYTGKENDRPFFVMEYVAGSSLAEMIQEQERLAPRQSAELLLQAARGLAAAHDRGIIHRDIKPSNLMIDGDGTLKVTDFGIALAADFDEKLTQTGQFVGTSGYVSPEACKGQTVDPRSDIFSLGIVLYEMLAGETPFHDDSPLGMLVRVVEQDVPDVRKCNPGVDEGLMRILERMVEKDPDDRYQTCHELATALQEWLKQAPADSRTTAPTEALPHTPPEQPQYRKRRWPAVLLVLLLVSAAAAGGWYYFGDGPWTRQSMESPAVADSAPALGGADEASPLAGEAEPVEPAASDEGSGSAAAGESLSESGAQRGLSMAATEETDPAPAESGQDPNGSKAQVRANEQAEPGPTASDPTRDEGERADRSPVAGDTASDQPVVSDGAGDSALAMVERADSASADAESEPAAATIAPSRPQPTVPSTPRAVVVASGDPALTGPVRAALARHMRTTEFELMDADLLPGVNAYLGEYDVDVGGLGELVRDRGGRVLVVARISYVGETPLEYYGRTGTLYTSRIEVRGYDLESGTGIGDGWSDEIRYTELNAAEKAAEAAAPLAAAVARAIERVGP